MSSGQLAADDQSIALLNKNHRALTGGITAEILIALLHP